MKILEIHVFTAHRVVTDSKDYPNHTRYSPHSWNVTMGESDEPVYDFKELEAKFQRAIALGSAKMFVVQWTDAAGRLKERTVFADDRLSALRLVQRSTARIVSPNK